MSDVPLFPLNFTPLLLHFTPLSDDNDPSKDVMTPNMNGLVKEGIEMDRQYVYKYCSPTRTAIQSGRNPYHVNPLNAAPEIYNPADPVSGMAAMPRNMTGMAIKMSAGGYKTHSTYTRNPHHDFQVWC